MAFAICFGLMLTLQLATPFWWWVMLVPFGYGIWKSRSAWEGARVGMFSAGALWLLMSLYQYATGGQQIATRAGGMLGMPSGALLIVLTAALAMIAAGVAGISGYLLKPVGRIIENRGAAGVDS